MKKYDFTVFGCASSVCVFKVKKLPEKGKTVWIENPNAEPFNGGVGFNICANLASLGASVYPVLSYPDSRLDRLLHDSFCPAYHWPADGLFGPPEGDYRMCFIFRNEQGDHMTVMYRYGDRAGATGEERPSEIKREFVSDSRMVILASPRPQNTEPILRMLQREGVPYVFSYRNDPVIFPEPILKEILLGASILFMNEQEAQDVRNRLGLDSIADLLRVGRAKVVAVTLGERGCVVYSDAADGPVRVPITQSDTGLVDTVGAGDAFLSGFMYGHINGKSLEVCAQYGNTMSSFAIERDGSTTNIPSKDRMLARNSRRPDAKEG